MEPHDEHDKKTQIFEKLDKLLKGVIALTCLTGVIAVAWLCTVGRAKAQEAAIVIPETAQEISTAIAMADPEPPEGTVTETEYEVITEIPEEPASTETEVLSETETEAETDVDSTVTARAVPMIPYGYEDKTEVETETEAIPDEDRFASADEEYRFDYREAWPQRDRNPGWYDREGTYEPRQYDRYEWPSDNAREYQPQEGRIYFFWF